jgi:hypothetical protein
MVVIDSYSETHYDVSGDVSINANSYVGVAQSFTCSVTGSALMRATFYLCRFNFPTGNVVANLYAHSGTYGSTSIPTGSPLATSAAVDIQTIPNADYGLVNFDFSSGYVMTNSAHYCISVEYSGGNTSQALVAGYDSTSAVHGGNLSELLGSTWAQGATNTDLCFYVYGSNPSVSSASTMQLMGV